VNVGNLRPWQKGQSGNPDGRPSNSKLQAEIITDLERDGRKVTPADKLLVQRYVELLRSRSHSDTNTALKIWQALADKYAVGKRDEMTLQRYAALQARKAAS
jgi:hypothetical protein